MGGVELSFPVTAHDALKHHLSTEAFRIHFDPFRAREWDQSEKSSGIYLQGFKAHYVWNETQLIYHDVRIAQLIRYESDVQLKTGNENMFPINWLESVPDYYVA